MTQSGGGGVRDMTGTQTWDKLRYTEAKFNKMFNISAKISSFMFKHRGTVHSSDNLVFLLHKLYYFMDGKVGNFLHFPL